MKIKYLFIAILVFLICASFSQLFFIPPYAGNIFKIYKSGYFNELDRGFEVIKDAFIETKMLSKPVYGWILLEDIEQKHAIKVKVYNTAGHRVTAPGRISSEVDKRINKVINSIRPEMHTEIRGGKYFAVLPVFLENRCRFCHQLKTDRDLAGVISFERNYNAHIYYTSERIIIFSIISLVLCSMLFLVIRWNPERKVKELFDKM